MATKQELAQLSLYVYNVQQKCWGQVSILFV